MTYKGGIYYLIEKKKKEKIIKLICCSLIKLTVHPKASKRKPVGLGVKW